MKKKNTAPSQVKAILCLMVSLTATLIVSSFIYFLAFHPLLDSRTTRIAANIGWTCFCLYAFKKLTERHTLWWQALEESPNTPKKN